MKRTRTWFLPLAILVVTTTMGAVLTPKTSHTNHEAEVYASYTRVLSRAHRWYAEEVPQDRMINNSIRSMLSKLDPHSYFLTSEEYRSMLRRQEGRFSGLGIMVSKRDGKVMVISPIEGTPAYRLGIRAGDIIVKIEDTLTEGMSIDEVVELLRGPEGTDVTITTHRMGVEDPLIYTITREVIPETSVRYAHLFQPGIGYVRVTDFNRTTAEELNDSLKELLSEGMTHLVLDLRHNPGGMLEQSVAVADLFLKPGEMVVYTKGRIPSSYQEFKAPGKYESIQIPVIVLVDVGSASASEIVAGAIQDHDRGLIIGNNTYGKGLVQSVYELHGKAAVALTTAKYFTPSGRCIQRPYGDLYTYLQHDDPDLEKLEKFLTDRGRTVYGGGGIHPDILSENPELPDYQQHLLARSAYFSFSLEYASTHLVPLDFEPNEEVIREFERYLIEENLAGEEDLTKAREHDRHDSLTRFFLKREILSARYGMEYGYKTVLDQDEQLSEALRHLSEAEELWTLYSRP